MQDYALLMKACINGLSTVVQELLNKQTIDINTEWYHSTPLMAACSGGHNKIVNFLLEHKADPNYISSIGNTALIRAVSAGNLKTVELLLEYGADPNICSARVIDCDILSGNTPLLRALYKGHSALVERLLLSGADPNYRQPLLVAAQWHDAVVRRTLVKLLLDYNAHPSIFSYDLMGQLFDEPCLETPVLYAILYNDNELLDMLIDSGLRLDALPVNGYRTPLHHAVRANNKPMIKRLMALGAFIHAQDDQGQTPLFYADFEDKELIALLVEAGADIEHKDHFGQTPLYTVLESTCWDGRTAGIYSMLVYGAQVNTQDNNGNSPLVFLLQKYTPDNREYIVQALEILLTVQADLGLANNQGETALSLAQKCGITLWT